MEVVMISAEKNLLNEILYIFKSEKLYAKIENKKLFKLSKDNLFIEDENSWDELLDILPQGQDLIIMKNSFNLQDDKEIFYFLKNPIGDFYFSTSQEYKEGDLKLSNLKNEKISFPNELNLNINIDYSQMYPASHQSSQNQKLSISGYQHKLQIIIEKNQIKESYSNFILKPASRELSKVAINEHLNTTFLKEFGFDIPFNAIIFDERFGEYSYIIKRFDIDKNSKKIPQISLNALMKSNDQYEGNIEEISNFLSNKLNKIEKIKFIKFIYANTLIFNSDLHKRNISFIFMDDELKLSPAYDILNVSAIKGKDKDQATLSINNKIKNIKIDDFDKAINILKLDEKEVKQELKKLLAIYIKKYPIYIKNISKLKHLNNAIWLQRLYEKSYKKILSQNKKIIL